MWSRFLWWLRREEEGRDLDEEIRAHLAIETRDRMERGEPPERARLATRRSFGNLGRIREETRDAWGWTELERLAATFATACACCAGRRLGRRPSPPRSRSESV
jgi:hypothetical protein